ncbi:hypothetical protein LTR20_000024 [Exophiala xenobiotica]|nr:hypothetical protein LTS13_007357 [Exophiala xenobiotica]KAK5401490.1 hypothetical protein LTR79_002009 [Exophiala xenobiotica]KAK5425252.1 hypothetical protein LTR90_000844 [Exophiala xenobiotica]KAK5472566.1 hypothetical protein LTR20_000024 [Exophiala xenobiotica]KAK5501148.1 hypothetical protein LTR26_000841 [Exophiala xenobiotica]
MRPAYNEPSALQRDEPDNRHPLGADNPTMPSSRIRGMHSEDSWIEIPSRPSSSSLSSASNDIVTTGLQIRPRDERLSRQPHISSRLAASLQPRSTSTAGSNQDEYEESESESDRVLSSSNEDISQDETAADDDDTSTALGTGNTTTDKVFTPQPNAFSHPPSSLQQGPIPDSYFPAAPGFTPERPVNERTITQRSYQRQNQSQSRYRAHASSYQPDHDAALRASLTTLLSCAAAVRPKGQGSDAQRPAAPTSRPSAQQATALRLVPESELENPTHTRPRPRRPSSPNKQTKRKSRESSKERHAKKLRPAKAAGMAGEELISPTLASWMISAGVVLVFSAISFSAGYAWGREVGRIESEMGGLSSGNCSREALRSSGSGLRRLRWTSAASTISA